MAVGVGSMGFAVGASSYDDNCHEVGNSLSCEQPTYPYLLFQFTTVAGLL